MFTPGRDDLCHSVLRPHNGGSASKIKIKSKPRVARKKGRFKSADQPAKRNVPLRRLPGNYSVLRTGRDGKMGSPIDTV